LKKINIKLLKKGRGAFYRVGQSLPMLVILNAIIIYSIMGLTTMATGTSSGNGEKKSEGPSMDNVTNALKDSKLLQVSGVIGIASLFIYIPVSVRSKRIKAMEDAIPDVLNEIAENIRSGRSVESAFKEVADVRTDRLGLELRRASEEMMNTSFEAAMRAFAQRTGSRAIIRIISLVLIAVESGASLANVLEKIAGELWEVYILKKDREAKSSTNASVILWGGTLFTAGIVGFILGFFNAGAGGASFNVDPYTPVFTYFMMAIGAECTLMRGVAMGTLKQDVIRVPFFMWLPALIYIVLQNGSGILMG